MTRNIAQVGVGYWGPNLLRNLWQNQQCQVSRVVELSKERQDYVRSQYPDIALSESLDAVLNDSQIEAVVIATPVHSHFSIARECLKAGKHILVEKPLVSELEQLDELQALAEAKNLVLMVGHTFLFNPAVQCMKQILDSGQLGDLRYIHSERLNLGRVRSDVDALWNLAPHDLSIIQYLLEDQQPIALDYKGMDYVQQGIDDLAYLTLHFEHKVMAHVHVSWLSPHKVRRMTLVGSSKMLVYDDLAENKISLCDKGVEFPSRLGQSMDFDHGHSSLNYRNGEVHCPPIDFQEPLKLEIAHFIDCINHGHVCQTGPAHARSVLQILCQARKQAAVKLEAAL